MDTTTSKKKKVAIVALVVLAIAIITAGTLAWQSFNAQAQNIIKGTASPAGGRLHDDFEVMGADFGKREWKDGLSANKDVYVENYEKVANDGKEIFTRVKLYEYMEIGDGATEDAKLPDNSENPAYKTRKAIPVIAGTSRDDVATWTARVPADGNASDAFKARFEWTQGGKKTYMPTFNVDSHSDETDIKGDARDLTALTSGESENSTEIGQAFEYSKDAGQSDYFVTNTTKDATEKYWDEEANNKAGAHAMQLTETTHTAKETVEGSVITMEEWKAAPYEGKPGDYWVVDVDGWAYWANPLAPENATGLLLDAITLRGEPDEDYYYSIYVKSEMATRADWVEDSPGQGFYHDATEAPSRDAEELMRIITGYNPRIAGVYLSQNSAAVTVNKTLSLTATVLVEDTTNPEWQEFAWSITPNVGSRFAGGNFTPNNNDAGRWYTITATSDKDPGKFAVCKVYVPHVTQGVLTGLDGANYVYFLNSDDNTYQKVNADGTIGNLVCPVELGKPGASTDRTNISSFNGVNYLDEGNDRYYAVGDDGKLGTGDDELMFNENGTMKPVDDVTRLTITPGSPEVKRGNSLDLTAAASFNSAPQDASVITWNLVGKHHADTTITGSGATVKLTVNEAESATALTLRLTYPGTNGTIKDITVIVKSPVDIALGAKTYTDSTGVVWRVIKDNREGAAADSKGIKPTGDGTILMVTDKTYGSTQYNGNNWTPWVSYDLSTFKTTQDNWYKTNASPDLKSVACLPNLAYESGTSPDIAWNAKYDSDSAISSAKGFAGKATNNGVVFPLSISESNRYLGTDKIAYRSENSQAFPYWLRSAGSGAQQPAASATYSAENNKIHNGAAVGQNSFGMRPAIWIDVTP